MFSIPSFTTVGDDYDKKSAKKHEHLKSFAVPGPKTGHLPDALFNKQFLSIHEGDKYIEPGTAERREKAEKEKKKIHPQGFRMASIPKKGCGLGSYFGCFSSTIPHETDFVVPRKGEAPPKKQLEKRNIVTAPTRKYDPLSHLGKEYIADFYDSQKEAEKKAQERHRQQVKGGPFRAACRLGGTFDEGMSTGVSKCYTMTKPMPPRRAVSPPAVKKPEHPWKPAGPTERLRPVVEYREDPYDGYDPRKGVAKPAKVEGKAGWKPGGATNSSWYTKSIAFARL